MGIGRGQGEIFKLVLAIPTAHLKVQLAPSGTHDFFFVTRSPTTYKQGSFRFKIEAVRQGGRQTERSCPNC